MIVERGIRDKLEAGLDPQFLAVANESHMHSVPPGSETHFKVVIVAERFEGLSRVARSRLVNEILKEELAGPVHALSMRLFSPKEWAEKGEHEIFASPACMGGSKVDQDD